MSTSTNPRHPSNHPTSTDPDVPQEPTGPIAADSLAAESLKSGGDFAANDPNAVPLGVPGAKSTLNTTDTSSASALPPAADGAAREKLNAKGLGSDEKGAAGVKYPEGAGQPHFDGKHTVGGAYYGGPSAGGGTSATAAAQAAGASDFGATTSSTTANTTTSSSTQTPSSDPTTTSTGVRPHVPAAPTYASRVAGTLGDSAEQQPKGADLTEGGDVPEGKKTFVGAVTGPNDPGRLGEREFEKVNAGVPGAGVGGVGGLGGSGGSGGKEGEGQFDVLGSERI